MPGRAFDRTCDRAQAFYGELQKGRGAMMMSKPVDAVTIRWTADATGRITFFNRDWTNYTGVADAEVYGSADAWISCVHPDDQALVRAMWSSRALEADSYVVRFRLLGHDGIFRPFQGVAVPVRDGGAVASWAGYCEPVESARDAR